jgi:hypothetical protein
MANIIDDQLDGGPQWIENLGHTPVWVEDKSQLKREMEKRNLTPLVKSERTPGPKSDDPRFHKDGWRVMQSTLVNPTLTDTLAGAAVIGRQTVAVDPELMAVLGTLGESAQDLMLGVVCTMCGEPFGAGNLPTDKVWKVECGCRTLVAHNPLRGKAY